MTPDTPDTPERFSPYAERLFGYPNRPRGVRVFWHVLGFVLALGQLAAGIWFGLVILRGVFWTIGFAWEMSPWGLIAGIAVLVIKAKLADRLPWTFR